MMEKKLSSLILVLAICSYNFLTGQEAQKDVYPGADENTPSLSQYFSWINNTNEGRCN